MFIKLKQEYGYLRYFSLLLASVVFTASQCIASEWSSKVGGGVSYSDNLYRASDDQESGRAYDVYMGINGKQQSSKYSASVASDLTYKKYSIDQDQEIVGAFSANAEYRPIYNFLTITAADSYGQYLTGANQYEKVLDTPSSRRAYNVFSLGSNLFIPLGARTKIKLNSQWIRAMYEGSPFDTTRQQYGSEISYALSPNSSAYASYATGRTKIDHVDLSQMAFNFYDFNESGVGLSLKSVKTSLNIFAGKTGLKYPQESRSPSTLLRADAARNIGKSISLVVNAGINYEDSGSNFVLSQNLYGVDSGPIAQTLTNDAFKYHYADVSMSYVASANDLSVGLNVNRSYHSINSQYDDERRSLTVKWGHRFSQRINVAFGSQFSSQKYKLSSIIYSDRSLSAALKWSLSQNADVNLNLTRNRGDQDELLQGLRPYKYNENVATLGLMYRLGR